MSARAEARKAVGGFSEPGKLPCFGWSISAKKCNVGGRLQGLKGSVCSKCYALKNRYVMPNVQASLDRRLNAYLQDPTAWVSNMILALEGETLFRWFDSGDIQSPEMLSSIVAVAKARPEIKFWLPTKEASIVMDWLRANGPFPQNLVVRLSLPMIDMFAKGREGLPVSMVSTDPSKVTCPSKSQGNKCLECRACWTSADIVYGAH